MSVHVVPEVVQDLHLLEVICWCEPEVEHRREELVLHQHRDDRPTVWLVISMDDTPPN